MDIDALDPNTPGQSSVYRGVTFNKKSRKWQSVLNVSGSHVHLGTFNTEADAAVAFDKAALIVRGERARINFTLANYLDANGRIIEDPVLKGKIESSCDPNRPKRRPPAPRGSGAAGPASANASLASISPYIQQLQQLQALTGGATGSQMGIPPYSIYLPQQQAAAAAAAAAAGVAAFGQQQAAAGIPPPPGSAAPGRQDAQMSAQNVFQFLNTIATPSGTAPAAGTAAASLPSLSALSVPGHAPPQPVGRAQGYAAPGAGQQLPSAAASYPGQQQGAPFSPAALAGFWDVVGGLRRGLPEDAELQCVLPCKGGQVIGVLYSQAGQWGACLLHGGQLSGHQLRGGMQEAMDYLMAILGLAASLQGGLMAPEHASGTSAGAAETAPSSGEHPEAEATASGGHHPSQGDGTSDGEAADVAAADVLQNFVALQALLAAAHGQAGPSGGAPGSGPGGQHGHDQLQALLAAAGVGPTTAASGQHGHDQLQALLAAAGAVSGQAGGGQLGGQEHLQALLAAAGAGQGAAAASGGQQLQEHQSLQALLAAAGVGAGSSAQDQQSLAMLQALMSGGAAMHQDAAHQVNGTHDVKQEPQGQHHERQQHQQLHGEQQQQQQHDPQVQQQQHEQQQQLMALAGQLMDAKAALEGQEQLQEQSRKRAAEGGAEGEQEGSASRQRVE